MDYEKLRTLGEIIQDARIKRGLTTRQLAARVNSRRLFVHNVEVGIAFPKREVLVKIIFQCFETPDERREVFAILDDVCAPREARRRYLQKLQSRKFIRKKKMFRRW